MSARRGYSLVGRHKFKKISVEVTEVNGMARHPVGGATRRWPGDDLDAVPAQQLGRTVQGAFPPQADVPGSDRRLPAHQGNVIARLVDAEERATAQGDLANLDFAFGDTLQVRSGPEQPVVEGAGRSL